MRANKWIVVATVATGKPIEHIYCATGHRHETQHGHSVLRNLSGLAPRVERPRLALPRSACSARSANSRCTALTALSVAAAVCSASRTSFNRVTKASLFPDSGSASVSFLITPFCTRSLGFRLRTLRDPRCGPYHGVRRRATPPRQRHRSSRGTARAPRLAASVGSKTSPEWTKVQQGSAGAQCCRAEGCG